MLGGGTGAKAGVADTDVEIACNGLAAGAGGGGAWMGFADGRPLDMRTGARTGTGAGGVGEAAGALKGGTVIGPLQLGHLPCRPAAPSLTLMVALQDGQVKMMGTGVFLRGWRSGKG